MLIRLGALAVLSVLSGLGGAIVVDLVFDALPGHFAALWWIGALTTFARRRPGWRSRCCWGRWASPCPC